MASTGSEIWLQWFACCYQPAAQAQRTRRRIDRSMIGAPTNFQHTGHIATEATAEHSDFHNERSCIYLRHHQRPNSIHSKSTSSFVLIPLLYSRAKVWNHLLGIGAILSSTDVDMPSSLLHSIQNQMQSKGGYEMAYGVKVY